MSGRPDGGQEGDHPAHCGVPVIFLLRMVLTKSGFYAILYHRI
jgi:hypothetical protein